MTRVEFGHLSWCPPFQGAELAAEDEELGFDIRYFGDNTCWTSDPFAELRAAAEATTRIKLATGATNTVTRHPSAVASAMAAVQLRSGGRAMCGVSKGDSAMGVIARGPQRHAEFVENTTMLRGYLRAERVRIGAGASRLAWLDDFPEYEPVPLEIMASGPKTLKAAAALADRVTLAVGAAPERIDWALGELARGLNEAGRDPAEVTVGAMICLCVDADAAAAVEQLRTRVRGQAHMSSFRGNDLTAQPQIMRRVTSQLRQGYVYEDHHLRGTSWSETDAPAGMVDAEFAKWFGIGGPAWYAVERIHELIEQGLRYFVFSGQSRPEREAILGEVAPEVRRLAAPHDSNPPRPDTAR